MKIIIHNQTKRDEKAIKKLLKSVFGTIEEDKNMQLILVEKDEIQRLNKFYRNIDKITDVLSFENDVENDDSLGDVFICLDKAGEQSLEFGHSFEREIAFLAVHGYLHLIGFDHQDEISEKNMIDMQESILEKANLRRENEINR